jgi:hypothetical protein
MWMSDVVIVVNADNADRNGLRDIASAVTDAGATLLDVDETRHVLAATLPAAAVATVWAMEGVTYVRAALTFFVAAA